MAQPRDMAFFPSRTPGRLVVLVFLASAHNNLCVRVILYMSSARRRYSAMHSYMTFLPYAACCFMWHVGGFCPGAGWRGDCPG